MTSSEHNNSWTDGHPAEYWEEAADCVNVGAKRPGSLMEDLLAGPEENPPEAEDEEASAGEPARRSTADEEGRRWLARHRAASGYDTEEEKELQMKMAEHGWPDHQWPPEMRRKRAAFAVRMMQQAREASDSEIVMVDLVVRGRFFRTRSDMGRIWKDHFRDSGHPLKFRVHDTCFVRDSPIL